MHPPPDDVFQQVPWFASTASGEVDLYASVGYSSSPGVARESRKASLAESTAWHKEEQERRESLPDKDDKVEKIDYSSNNRMSAVADRGYRNVSLLINYTLRTCFGRNAIKFSILYWKSVVPSGLSLDPP